MLNKWQFASLFLLKWCSVFKTIFREPGYQSLFGWEKFLNFKVKIKNKKTVLKTGLSFCSPKTWDSSLSPSNSVDSMARRGVRIGGVWPCWQSAIVGGENLAPFHLQSASRWIKNVRLLWPFVRDPLAWGQVQWRGSQQLPLPQLLAISPGRGYFRFHLAFLAPLAKLREMLWTIQGPPFLAGQPFAHWATVTVGLFLLGEERLCTPQARAFREQNHKHPSSKSKPFVKILHSIFLVVAAK